MNAPRKGTKEYERVLKAGCGGYQDSYTLDYDCTHRYDWNCDDCPIVVEKEGSFPNPAVSGVDE